MLKYYFYSKSDSTKEIIDQIQAKDLETAVAYFTQRKNLPKDKFFELYGVGIKNLKWMNLKNFGNKLKFEESKQSKEKKEK